jgi:hypothetical protein
MKAKLPSPRWLNANIVAAAGRLAQEFEDRVGRDYIEKHGQRFEDVYEKLLYPKFGIGLSEGHDLGTDEAGKKILGVYKIHADVAQIDSVLDASLDDPRRVFTLYHEVAGHGALQGKWLRTHLREFDLLEVTDVSISAAAEQRIERQANLFAAHLAAPDWLIDFAIVRKFAINRPFVYTGQCQYCLNTRGGLWLRPHITDAMHLCQIIGSKINEFFGGLSAEALGYRIAQRGWIDDKTGSLKVWPRNQLFRRAV